MYNIIFNGAYHVFDECLSLSLSLSRSQVSHESCMHALNDIKLTTLGKFCLILDNYHRYDNYTHHIWSRSGTREISYSQSRTSRLDLVEIEKDCPGKVLNTLTLFPNLN